MIRILKEKGLSTRFQILVEIAAQQPNVQQKDIARRLQVTPQAISEYMDELIGEGMISSQGRSKYTVTQEGLDWVLRQFRDLEGYSSFIRKTVSDIAISAAIAADNLAAGQRVGLEMREGLLYAVADENAQAGGTAISNVLKGEDVGITTIEGIIPIKKGTVTILRVPGIREGGSRAVDLIKLKKEVATASLLGAIGPEAVIALRRTGLQARYLFGVNEAAVEAAHRGISFTVVCASDSVSELIQRLDDAQLEYRLLDMRSS